MKATISTSLALYLKIKKVKNTIVICDLDFLKKNKKKSKSWAWDFFKKKSLVALLVPQVSLLCLTKKKGIMIVYFDHQVPIVRFWFLSITIMWFWSLGIPTVTIKFICHRVVFNQESMQYTWDWFDNEREWEAIFLLSHLYPYF